jgi:hypothetical protein
VCLLTDAVLLGNDEGVTFDRDHELGEILGLVAVLSG